MRIESKYLEFDWDKGNVGKNKKHDVTDSESEESFTDEKKIIYKDALHSASEDRLILIGKTKLGRLLYVVFTRRHHKIRIISARNVNRKEAPLYEETT